jgi:hypothetical protein
VRRIPNYTIAPRLASSRLPRTRRSIPRRIA